VVTFINYTETIGQVVGNANSTLTGSLFLTMFIIFMVVLAITIFFGIRLEYTALLILPLLIGLMAFNGSWGGIVIVVLIYTAFIITKNFIFR
jgi:hypothetical protein